MCNCAPYYSHRVSTKLQFTNISYHRPHITSCMFQNQSGTSKHRTAECIIVIIIIIIHSQGLGGGVLCLWILRRSCSRQRPFRRRQPHSPNRLFRTAVYSSSCHHISVQCAGMWDQHSWTACNWWTREWIWNELATYKVIILLVLLLLSVYWSYHCRTEVWY